jgi:glutathione synthase/RimK-type ligase-like ATP-grasp enzyme
MQFLIGIQPDDYGRGDRYSTLWTRLLERAGHLVKAVDVHRADIFEQLKGCHAFMWRHGHLAGDRQIAKRLLPVLENELKIVVYPDQKTCWHYDDKIIQKYLLEANKIPIPDTWIWYDKKSAKEWARTAAYPLVLKLWTGTGSKNVRLISSFREAAFWIDKLFDDGVYDLSKKNQKRKSFKTKIKNTIKFFLTESTPQHKTPEKDWELHKNYVLFQEFLSGNDFDYRIVVIGNRAFGFRRFNRADDFRASGSGNSDTDPSKIDDDAVKLVFQLSKALGTQSIAADILRKGQEFVIGEISYTFPHWTVHSCPGHWILKDKLENKKLTWVEGQMWPENAQIEDFLNKLQLVYK